MLIDENYNKVLKQIVQNRMNEDIKEVFNENEIQEILTENSKIILKDNNVSNNSIANNFKNLDLPIKTNETITSNKNSVVESELDFNKISPDKRLEPILNNQNFLNSNGSFKKQIEDMQFVNQKSLDSEHSQSESKLKEIQINFGNKKQEINASNLKNTASIIQTNENENIQINKASKPSDNLNTFNNTKNAAKYPICPICKLAVQLTDGSNLVTCMSIYCKNKKSFCRLCNKTVDMVEKSIHYPLGVYIDQCLYFDWKKKVFMNKSK